MPLLLGKLANDKFILSNATICIIYVTIFKKLVQLISSKSFLLFWDRNLKMCVLDNFKNLMA